MNEKVTQRHVLDAELARHASLLGEDMPADDAKAYVLLALSNAGLLREVPYGFETADEWLDHVADVSRRALEQATAREGTERQPTLSIDFDGVIHRYSKGWQNGEIYDPPTDGCRIALAALASSYRLVVHTARENHRDVWAWLDEHDLRIFIDAVSNTKPGAVAYIDDRAVLFSGSWPLTMAYVKAIVELHDARKSP